MAITPLTFLFGAEPDPRQWNVDDHDERVALLAETFGDLLGERELLSFEIIANQILDGNPPEVWATAQRLHAIGQDPFTIMNELVVTFAPTLNAAMAGKPYDDEVYLTALARLPLPGAKEVEDALVSGAEASPGISADDLVAGTLEQTGRDPDDAIAEDMVDFMLEQLSLPGGPLAWTAGARVVNVETLTEGIVATHRLTEWEQSTGSLVVGFDLAGFTRAEDLSVDGGHVEVTREVPTQPIWRGPSDWFDGIPVDAIIAVRLDAEGSVTIELVDEMAQDSGLVDRVRAVYRREVDDAELPVTGEELVLALLLDDRATFDEPRPPLSELAEAAGLEIRLDSAADDEAIWRNRSLTRQSARLIETFGTGDALRPAMRVLEVADLLAGLDPALATEVEGPVDTTLLRSVLADLHDQDLLAAVATELLLPPEGASEHRADLFVEALLNAASRPLDLAVARLLAALQSEQALQPLVAQQHLELAHEADPESPIVIDRLAWYASDRGDAPRAAHLWRQLDHTPGLLADLRAVEDQQSPRAALPGRNDPCWCGSGRKFKQCHLGSTDLAPLADRVPWLWRKAVSYLERQDEAQEELIDLAFAIAADPDDRESLLEALDEPIVMDLALTEGGWFEEFLEGRGELLPDDELALARSWLAVDRTIYEVVSVQPVASLELRDLRTDEPIIVRAPTLGHLTGRQQLICGRAVPDGETSQLVGAVIAVAPGRETSLFQVLDLGDAEILGEWFGTESARR